jgi:hypothetical protein
MQLTCKCSLLLACLAAPGWAADPPYFVTYSHQLEEPGSLEVATDEVVGSPK